jgi:hypothetical protein
MPITGQRCARCQDVPSALVTSVAYDAAKAQPKRSDEENTRATLDRERAEHGRAKIRMVNGRSIERPAHRVASVTSVRLAIRSAPIARLRRAAMTLGPFRVLTLDLSSW